ncbi:unnamed protein product, partial [Amoebophrya sp. A25]
GALSSNTLNQQGPSCIPTGASSFSTPTCESEDPRTRSGGRPPGAGFLPQNRNNPYNYISGDSAASSGPTTSSGPPNIVTDLPLTDSFAGSVSTPVSILASPSAF